VEKVSTKQVGRLVSGKREGESVGKNDPNDIYIYKYNRRKTRKLRNPKRESGIHPKTRRNGSRKQRKRKGGNAARRKSSCGPISHMVSTEVCTSVIIAS